MTINERIREFRKSCNMNQRQFANVLGVAQTGISYMEKPGNNISEQSIKSMCLAFPNLNEEWLRNGKDPMIIEPDTFSLDEFLRNRGMEDIELEAIKAYFDLDPSIRKAIISHFKNRLSRFAESSIYDECPATPEELESKFPPVDLNSTKKEVG